MNPDDLKPAWRDQTSWTRLTIEPDLLVEEVRRRARSFDAVIFWRDVREVGVCLVMIPLWVYLGIHGRLPWTWYLTILALVWIAGFMLVDRVRQNRRRVGPDEPLRPFVASLLARVEHQIQLLRRVHIWYLFPFVLPFMAFFGQVAWNDRSGGWNGVLAASMASGIVIAIFGFVYWLNQYAVRADLEPRRRELEALLASLEPETPGES